jgi:ATP-binding cassette subfamily B protein
LDAEAVQQALENLKKQRTTFIIAHRLATVSADRIIVLKEGLIAETGTHASLMRAGGYCASLVRRQSRGLIANDVDPSARLDGTGYTDYSTPVPHHSG